jgi:uncharacterized membrane protein YheB (UPF0754 family)
MGQCLKINIKSLLGGKNLFKMTLNANLITNIIALIITIIGYFMPIYGEIFFLVGIFALSGALTNWLAIHMLFERVPFLYGSGVILNRFDDFKKAIKKLIINEFFNKEHIEKFFKDNNDISSDKINKKINFDKIFDGLCDAIIESPMGSMLSMIGGKEALIPIKEPIILKLKDIIAEFVDSNNSDDLVQNISVKIEKIIDDRLSNLTPIMVKKIIQNMIQRHLGWLVVWGGFFGGLMGLICSLVKISY